MEILKVLNCRRSLGTLLMGPRSEYSLLFDQSKLTNRYLFGNWGGIFGPFGLVQGVIFKSQDHDHDHDLSFLGKWLNGQENFVQNQGEIEGFLWSNSQNWPFLTLSRF